MRAVAGKRHHTTLPQNIGRCCQLRLNPNSPDKSGHDLCFETQGPCIYPYFMKTILIFQNKVVLTVVLIVIWAHSTASREGWCRGATNAQQGFHQARPFPTCAEAASAARSDRFPAAPLPRCTPAACFQYRGMLLKPLAWPRLLEDPGLDCTASRGEEGV